MKKRKRMALALTGAMLLGMMPGMSMVAQAEGTSSDYTLTIPATLTVTNSGWNATSGITANNSANNFHIGKTLSVTASSTNSWALKSGENSIGYNLATASGTYSSIATAASWEFLAAELNEDGGKNKAMGIIVEDYSDKPTGCYTDTVTFTASVAVKLENLTSDYEAQDGDTLTGTLAGNYKVTVADGANITLENADITNLPNDRQLLFAGISCIGDATIKLVGENKIKGGYEDYPGLFVPENKTLTIEGDGSLEASSNGCGPGIGGGYHIACGNIKINSGTITASGGEDGAGIGSGSGINCGNIEINGGTVIATGGSEAAGIGGGSFSYCGNIEINGGTIKATGGERGAGIGTGCFNDHTGQGRCGHITVSSEAIVEATKGKDALYSIGMGVNCTCGTITIGGTVYWENNAAQNNGATYLAQSPLKYPEVV